MTSAVYDRTKNLGLGLIEFSFPNWADDANLNMSIIDAAMQVLGMSIKGAWDNSIPYNTGDLVVDSDLNTLWRAAIVHTSSPTGTMAQERVAHPNYWLDATQALHARGQWMPGTTYYFNDVAYNGYMWVLSTQQHMSSANLNDDIAAGKMVIVTDSTDAVDDSTAASNVAVANASASSASATSANIAATNSANSATAASGSQSAASASASAAQVAENNAELAEANAQAIFNAMYPDAVSDGLTYGRKNGTWSSALTEAPLDGFWYARKSGNWVPATGAAIVSDTAPTIKTHGQLWYESDTGNMLMWYSSPSDPDSSQWIQVSGYSAYSTGAGGGIGEAPVDGHSYARRDSAWVDLGGNVAVPEVPNDGKSYVRKFGLWQELIFPTPPTVPFVFDTNGDAVCKFGASIVIRIKSTGLILTKDDIEVFSVSV